MEQITIRKQYYSFKLSYISKLHYLLSIYHFKQIESKKVWKFFIKQDFKLKEN